MLRGCCRGTHRRGTEDGHHVGRWVVAFLVSCGLWGLTGFADYMPEASKSCHT